MGRFCIALSLKMCIIIALRRFTKFLFCSDLHGEEKNKSAVDAVLRVRDDLKPDVKIFGGDLFDMRCLLNQASDEDRSHDPEIDFKHGTEFLEDFRPDVFIWGNHDKRILKLANSKKDGARRALGQRYKQVVADLLKRLGAKQILYKSSDYYKLGCMKFLHGVYCGQNACAQHVNMCLSTCVFGHTHAIKQEKTANQEGCIAYNTGCLCNVEMEWNEDKPQTLRQENGFAYGVANNKEHYLVQARKVGDTWICPTI